MAQTRYSHHTVETSRSKVERLGVPLSQLYVEVLMRRRIIVSALLIVGGFSAASLLVSSTVGFWIGALVAFIGVLVLVAGSGFETVDYVVRGPQARMQEHPRKRPRPFG